MKKTLYILSIAGLLMAISCQKESPREIKSPAMITLTIGAETAFSPEDDSKIALSGTNAVWEGNESMAIIIGDAGSTSAGTGLQPSIPSKKAGVFTGTISLSPYTVADMRAAVVPSDNGAWYNGTNGALMANVPEAQTQTWAGTFNGGNVPFYSFIGEGALLPNGDDNFTFRAMTLNPACAILRLNFFGTAPGMDNDESFKSVVLYAADSKGLAGTVSIKPDGSCTVEGAQPVTMTLDNGSLIAGKARNQGIKTFVSILPYGDAGQTVTVSKMVVTTDKADYTANFAQELSPKAGQVIQAAIDMAGFGDREIHNMFSIDGGETWTLSIPAVFRNLAVKGKISDATLTSIRQAIELQPLPVALDLSEATPLGTEFPASFAGTSEDKPYRQLLSVKLPAGINSLSDGCFKYCTGLKSVDFAEVMTIGESAFFGCTSIATFDFSKVNHILSHAFGQVPLEEVDLTVCPEGTVVEKCAFSEATSETDTGTKSYNTTMKTLRIGKNVTLVNYAFYRMGALTYLYLDSPSIGKGFAWRSTNNYSTSLSHTADLVVELGPNAAGGGSAFWCNANVSKVIFHKDVTTAPVTFSLCRHIATIECRGMVPPTITTGTFATYGKTGNKVGDLVDATMRKLIVPVGAEDNYNDAGSPWKTHVQDDLGYNLVTATFD